MRKQLVQWTGDFQKWKWAAFDLFAPPACTGCGRIGTPWCQKCLGATHLLEADICLQCGGLQENELCLYCEASPSNFDAARSFALYQDPFRKILLRFKYRQDASLGNLVANWVGEFVSSFASSCDVVVPVPLGPGKMKLRGFNQVDTFAKPLAAVMGKTYETGALVRVRETRSQVGLSGDQRRENLVDAFKADHKLIDGRDVLLVDDVFTTGATANTCARILKKAGAQTVWFFTLARANEKGGDAIKRNIVENETQKSETSY